MMTLPINHKLASSRWLSLAMLVTLHIAAWVGVESIWARPFLFAHLGLFLMWQPLWRGEEKLPNTSVVMLLTISVIALIGLNWWMLAFWVSGLFSLVGGRVFAFQSKWQRFHYLLVMGYLLALLLLWLTPQLFSLPVTVEASTELMVSVLPLLFFIMLFMPKESERLKKTGAVDFIYSILLFMLLTLLVLGSLAFMSLGHVDYFQALIRTLFLIALVLFMLGLLWNPRLGFSGFQVIFSRYFLNIGTPFEQWLKRLASISRQEQNPKAFLVTAMGHLVELHWLSGLKWTSEEGEGMQGESTTHKIDWVDHDLKLTLFSRQRVSPTVLMHIQLFCQMLAYFYQSKRHEQRLREMARLQAVHETGARLTHDLKNMLQSLFALISIAEQQPAQAQPILHNRLPLLARQIELVLSKLKIPKQETETNKMPLATWWNMLQQRQQYRNLNWLTDEEVSNQEIPLNLFDSIADNLIENARNKRLREPGIAVQVSLQHDPVRLSVCDSGGAIAEGVANQLLHTVVDSEDGLGIGLFQAARWAEQMGYSLALQENRNGRVCFQLTKIVTS